MSDKTRVRRHRHHDVLEREALGDRVMGPTHEERQAKRAHKSRRLRKLRKKAAGQ